MFSWSYTKIKINISYISATIRSIPKHRNCTDLEIVGPLKMYMANAKFREEKKQLSISNA